jgi:hypothetical protein
MLCGDASKALPHKARRAALPMLPAMHDMPRSILRIDRFDPGANIASVCECSRVRFAFVSRSLPVHSSIDMRRD